MPEPHLPRGPDNHLCFDFHGVRVALDGDAAVVEELARDFAWFRAAQGPCGLAIELLRAAPERFHGRARAWPRTPRYRVADAGSWRTVLYRDGSRLVWDFAARRGTATAPEAWRLRELGYLAVLSRVGEALEDRGWSRVHALGLTLRGEAGLVLLPSGGGKSVLALAALRAEGWGLLSDDTPLIRSDGTARAFPLRLSFLLDQDLSLIPPESRRTFSRLGRPDKIVVDLPFFRERVSGQAPLRWIAVGARRPGAKAAVEPCSRARALAVLCDALVVGRGIAQLSELMVRQTLSLTRLACARWDTARAVVSRARLFSLRFGDDPAAALACLADDS
ncbi:MAG TPA: hypothetical protein DCZ01_13215 [Elusimicrobia bacterium]|nr:MAG: hypothetical protein A2X37_08265 [Elusimicrobia bacterium GWA2_66_18]OGR72012.1 MAG: hypothetical protein A2X40_05205 [Elusimicrobia bacterium GWC2_65_9]HAZ09443.1 hypothetical protein [Elusimicrobiota bacterium]